jgi:phage protein D
MALAAIRVYLNDTPASEEQLDLFREISVDQAIGVAAEAELKIDLVLDDQGYWSTIEEDFAQAFQRVRVEVKLGEGEFTPLIDGPIVAQRFELGAGPAQSALTLVVHDDSVLLNQVEQVNLFEDMPAHEIAQALIAQGGLTAEVESVDAAGGAHTRYVVQRGTAMQLLRDLARRNGMFVYVKPGQLPGQSVCVFSRPALQPGDAGELLLIGEERNIHKFSAQFDALQPVTARAGGVRISDKAELTSQSDAPGVEALGADGVHDVLSPTAISLLSRTREEQNDLDAATAAAVDLSSFAYTATAEIDANDYDRALSPYQVISVAGPGGYLGGNYLISRVHHLINDSGYRQSLTLKRNARSGGSQSSGGLPGGVF